MAKPDAKIAIDFIDPLFAIVLHLSFAKVEQQTWFDQPSQFFSDPAVAFSVCAWGLALLTVLLSWVGYHQSIRSTSINVETLPGFGRFTIDVVLLGMYWLLLVRFDNFQVQLWVLFLVYAAFVVWDQFKVFEYSEEERVKRVRRLRRGVSVFWLSAFALLLALYYVLGGRGGNPGWVDVLCLALAVCFTIMYRVNKIHQWPKRIMNRLGAPTLYNLGRWLDE